MEYLRVFLFFLLALQTLFCLGEEGVSNRQNQPSIPKKVKIELSSSKKTYYIGEKIIVSYKVINTGKKSFIINIGGDYRSSPRALRFKVKSESVAGEPVLDPYSILSFWDGGGFSYDKVIEPNKSYSSEISIGSYLNFQLPGTYVIKISHAFGWKKKKSQEYPFGSIILKIVEPSKKKAKRFIKKWIEQNNTSEQEKINFSELRSSVYFKPLVSYALEENGNAFEGIGSIETIASTKFLIGMMKQKKNDTLVWLAWHQLKLRLPNPYLSSRYLSQTHNKFIRKKNRPFELLWKKSFDKEMRSVAIAFIKSNQDRKVNTGAYLLARFGLKEDVPMILDKLTKEIEKQPPYKRFINGKIVFWNYGKLRVLNGDLLTSVELLVNLGFEAPSQPNTLGEKVMFLLAIKYIKKFQPQNWAITYSKLMSDRNKIIKEFSFSCIPSPIPQELVKFLSKPLQSNNAIIVKSICGVIKNNKLKELKGDVLVVLQKCFDPHMIYFLRETLISIDAQYDFAETLVNRMDQSDLFEVSLMGLMNIFDKKSYEWTLVNDTEATKKEMVSLKSNWLEFIKKHQKQIRLGKQLEMNPSAMGSGMFPGWFKIKKVE